MAVSGAPTSAAARRDAALAVLIFASALALYWPIRSHEWLNYDDPVYITANPDLALGLSRAGIAWAFGTFQGANWFPLTRLSWMLDLELHGLDAGAFLTTNLLLHAGNAALLFLALNALSGYPWRSAFAGAVFALHPLHVESVAWAAARKDPLSGAFFLLALLIYARRARAGLGWRAHAALLACLALALMAKPTAVVLPFTLLLLDWWPLRRLHGWRPWLEKLPMLALVIAFSFVAVAAQRSEGVVVSLARLPLDARVFNAVTSYASYLGKVFWPSHLAVFYPHAGSAPPGLHVAAGLVLLVALSAAALRLRARLPALLFGWLWFLGTTVPVIGLVQVGSQAMADRYMYLPLIGPAVAVAWCVADLLPARPGRSAALGAAAAACLALLAITSARQIRHWRSSEALFEHALAVTSGNHVAHTYLAVVRLEQGRVDDALAGLSEAVRLRPDFLTAVNNLAWLRATLPDAAQRNAFVAVRLAERAAELTRHADPAVLDTLAAAYAEAGRFEEAVRTGERGVDLAERSGRTDLAAQLRERIALYRARRPYRAAAR